MTASKEHADEVLQSFRKRRPTPACYPCSKRKVRCKGGRPCGPCTARGHPEICLDGDQHRRSKLAAAVPLSAHETGSRSAAETDRLGEQGQTLNSTPAGLTELQPATTLSPSEPRVGKFSAMNFIRGRLSSAHKVLDEDIHPSMGLGNTDLQGPSLAPLGAAFQGSLLPPSREEVLQYYPAFRDCIMPLYPIVYDVVLFESTMYKALKDPVGLKPEQVAVVVASLALGAQFAELGHQKSRRQISLDLIHRSNAYAQQANYIFRPSLEAVQALLMVGMALQNVGQSDGAWALLGLNFRLAQTLGLHLLSPDEGAGATLWGLIVWQDAFLSCRYDRSPLSHGSGTKELSGRYDLSYFQAMKTICALDSGVLRQPQSCRSDPKYVSSIVRDLDELLGRCSAHLQVGARPRTMQQRLEQNALQLHHSLFLADLCRPMFSIAAIDANKIQKELRRRGFNALIANIEAFLEICAFSNIALRLWSMTQATVTCALVLALIDSRTTHPTVVPLLRRLVKALKMDTGSSDPTVKGSVHNLPGICLMRIKGAGLLESILDNPQDTSSTSPERMDIEKASAATDNVAPSTPEGLPFAEDLAWPAELPLFDRGFADSVLDFDLDQSWYESITGYG
ncbi:uncharacterized protein HMPREF1541_03438 [Cyphellophora europaea CBS 101466]|uniref:Zn(2)-C6 fungal-type domain-containing protein n=1 Tax=Cyphellophora europaea (strain CBS 101466) TaxID=1220924 RepID=W2RYI6_CYPE1|nr:uncharacterized protein HMPREF1541_03438 [Cyphellophora europaea CBS 101466]ETN41502.1 hypothetical protein HMPREF1541_03438 [Cyphellophora europaea CBS 101466]